MKISLPAEFVRTVLFWVSFYLFGRYFLDILSELVFFTWPRTLNEEAKKWSRLIKLNCQMISLLRTGSSEFVVDQIFAYSDPGLEANSETVLLNNKIHAIRENHSNTSTLSPAEKASEQVRVVEDARLHILSASRRMYWWAWWNLFRSTIGIIPFVGILVFDALMPILVFDAVLSVAQGDPIWLKYKNLQWWFDGN